MQKHHKTDTAFSHLMSNMLDKTSQYLELVDEPVNDQHEQLLAQDEDLHAAREAFAMPAADGERSVSIKENGRRMGRLPRKGPTD